MHAGLKEQIQVAERIANIRFDFTRIFRCIIIYMRKGLKFTKCELFRIKKIRLLRRAMNFYLSRDDIINEDIEQRIL